MQLYPRTSQELVLDLIAKSNPGLPFPLTAATVYVGPPTAVPVVPPEIVNTTARISSRPSSKYNGSKVVSYQRINLANLFLNVTPNIKKYSANGEAGSNPFTVFQLLPFLNDQYGLKLAEEDVVNGIFPVYSTIIENGVSKKVSSFNMVASALSKAFIGSVTIRTQAGQRDLNTVILKAEIPGRLYPGGNDFDANKSDRLNCLAYGVDFTENMVTINPATTVSPLTSFSSFPVGGGNDAYALTQQTTFDIINSMFGTALTTGRASPTPSARWNLVGAQGVNVVLPNAAYPEANSKDFNRVMVIRTAVAHSWATGALYLHYNV